MTDRAGRLLAFGAILRHDAHSLTGPDPSSPSAVVEGARTTAALVASRFGPVLKVSEDGIVSCFLDGTQGVGPVSVRLPPHGSGHKRAKERCSRGLPHPAPRSPDSEEFLTTEYTEYTKEYK